MADKVYVSIRRKDDDKTVAKALWFSSSKDELISDLQKGEEDGTEIRAPEPSSETKKPETKTSYERIAQDFNQSMDGMRTTIPVVMTVLPVFKDFIFSRELVKYVEEHGDPTTNHGDWELFELDDHHFANLNATARKLRAIKGFQTTLPKMFIMGLVATYDGFVGNLLKEAIRLKPEILSPDKTLTLAELRSLGSVESATEYFVEREVDAILRGSHQQQFEWIKRHFNIDVEDTFEKWPELLEIFERRNLFTHNNGVVNQGYLSFLEKQDIEKSEVKIGDVLGASPTYMNQALDIFYELGVELCHVFWRKTAKGEAEQADSFVNDVGFELLGAGRPEVARRVLEYGRSLRDHHSAKIRLMMLVNLANAYRMLGDHDECCAVLKTQDWSASSADFRLAVAALQEQWDDAVSIMREIGSEGSIGDAQYRNWPVFTGLIDQVKFKDAYEEIFGKPFESAPTQVEVMAPAENKES